MKVEIRIEGDPEQIARFLREMATQQIVNLAESGDDLDPARGMGHLPIEDLAFGVRSYNCLRRVGIETIGELVSKTEYEITQIPLLGQKEVGEIKEELAARGLHLRPEGLPVAP